ncbi:MAG: alpha/beta fold hydrolase [Janthinobacterium lividum]
MALALARHHRVLRYDLRGFGQSEKLAGAVMIDQEVTDLDALIAHSGLHGRVVLVGGAIAADYASLHPDKVRGLVAISPIAGVTPAQRAVTGFWQHAGLLPRCYAPRPDTRRPLQGAAAPDRSRQHGPDQPDDCDD